MLPLRRALARRPIVKGLAQTRSYVVASQTHRAQEAPVRVFDIEIEASIGRPYRCSKPDNVLTLS